MLPKRGTESNLHERELRVEVIFANQPTEVEKSLLVGAPNNFKTDLISIHAISIENILRQMGEGEDYRGDGFQDIKETHVNTLRVVIRIRQFLESILSRY
jgi:hypothetical protein